MDQIIITALTENMINVTVPLAALAVSSGFLLSDTGTHLQKFALAPGSNDITLNEQKAGMYVIRIETDHEVAVKQIFITKKQENSAPV